MADLYGSGPNVLKPVNQTYQMPQAQDFSTQLIPNNPTPATGGTFQNPFSGGGFANNWDPTMSALFNQNPSDAITNLFMQGGQSLANPYLGMYKALAPGMQWLDLLGQGSNS